jgi:dethiobiotin synthetase
MANGVFVTGTDTGVGKTYVSCLLLKWLKSKDVDAGVMKPVETGCDRGLVPDSAGSERSGDAGSTPSAEGLVPEDALKLVEAAATSENMSLVAPFRFSKPVAPMVAAQEEGRAIDPQEILRCYRKISSLHSFTVVEGAGGLLVPITPEYSTLDLASDMDIPLLVVAASKLGVINHSLLTLEVIRARGLKVAALVLNNLDSEIDDARSTNAAALRELVSEPVVELRFGATEADIAEIGGLLGC